MTNPEDASGGRRHLEEVIAEHLARWKTPHVELSIHGNGDAAWIASELDAFCQRELGVPIANALFYRSSIGAVAGVKLCDARRVVIKAHPPDWSHARLSEVARLQRHVAECCTLAPAVLVGPSVLGLGLALVEPYVERGELRDAHDPEVRRGLARSLHALVELLAPQVSTSALPSLLLTSAPSGRLWPTPHSRLFDFEATGNGAEDIDQVATEARAHMSPTGRVVIAHGDWRAEHVRFEDDLPVVAFDWDSLCKETEPAVVGFTAHAFCADWTRGNHAQAPTLAEARAFVADYESARGHAFTGEERRQVGACFAYSVAYTARCAHALGNDERRRSGTFQHLLARHGSELLALY